MAAAGAELWADAAGYKAVFGAEHVEFVPAFGPRAARNYPIRYELESIGRGRVRQVVEAASRSHRGLQVEFARGTLIERYEVREDGIEQSFVVRQPPLGPGDLIVRGRLTSDLPAVPHAGGLRFEGPGVGACTLGAVTGIDANGRRVGGTIRFDGEVVEYILPSAWVETARFPVVVDPLIGSTAAIPDPATGLHELPDVAYDETHDVYLVVFVRQWSAVDFDVHAQRLDRAGSLVGSRILIENSGAFDYKPQVANVNLRDRFVVVWQRGSSGATEVHARSVDAGNGALSVARVISPSGLACQDPDVGGEATEADEDAICVWHDATQDQVTAAQIGVNPDGSLFEHDLTTIAFGASERPCISKSGGGTGRHMVGWMRRFTGTDYDPICAVVDREITVLASQSLDGAVNFTAAIDIDGNGNEWVAAWQVRESSGLLNDVVARSLAYSENDRSSYLQPIAVISNQAGTDETDPSVCWLGNATLVGYTNHQTSTSTSAWVRSIDSHTCFVCEANERLVASLTDDAVPVAASMRSGGADIDEALVAFHRRSATIGRIHTRVYDSEAGVSRTVQEGCGIGGGWASATCARNGNAGFAVRVIGAAPNTAAVLVGSRAIAPIPCGPCRLLPNPYAGFIHSTATDTTGAAALTVAIPAAPAFVGVEVFLQWAVFEPLTPGCFLFASDLSTAIRVTVE
ncbi:MAG: hypothetical protein NXI31_01550 [bacterium]|nr:hypothetical protein [bacterium]